MIIKYKNYRGALIKAEQIKGSEFYFQIKDSDGITISFVTEIQDIRLPNCIANDKITSEIKN